MDRHVVVVLGHRWRTDLEREILGPNVCLVDGNAVSPMELEDAIRKATAVLVGSGTRLDAERIRSLSACRAIVRYGIGVDNIDVRAARQQGIHVANVPDYCIAEVADHTVALLLAVARRLPEAAAAAQRREWGVGVMSGVRRLSTQVVGIVGFGRIGRLTMQRLRPFGPTVLVYDPFVDSRTIRLAGGTPVSLDQLLVRADFVVLQCPLDDTTHHLLNRERLARMKPHSWVINTSRGGLIDTVALFEALREHRIAGAALDVLDAEPPGADHPLLGHHNVLITPHVAWYSEEATMTLRQKAAEQVKKVLMGGTPDTRVD